MATRSWVLDASAVLALVNQERGQRQVAEALGEGGVMSAVNLSELVAKLTERGMPEGAVHGALDFLGMEIVDLDVDGAYRTGLLRPLTRSAGLSLGDRACLALAQDLKLPVVTADRSWTSLRLGVSVRVIR